MTESMDLRDCPKVSEEALWHDQLQTRFVDVKAGSDGMPEGVPRQRGVEDEAMDWTDGDHGFSEVV